MRILFVSPRQGWPSAGGSKIREYHFLRALAERFEVTYVFFREPQFEAPRPQDLPFCKEIIGVAWPRPYSPGRLLRGLVSHWPLPVLNYTSQPMSAVIRRLSAATPFDVVHFDGIHLAAYASMVRSVLPGARQFFNWHNIESEGMFRYAELTSSPIKTLYAGITAKGLARVEKDLLLQSDGTFVCSEREREQLSHINPQARIGVVENGVDINHYPFRETATAAPNPKRIVFIGLMAYHANVDAAVWFAREIWPRLREQLPGRILTIVGANPVEAVLALRSEPGVEVTGTVPDVRPYYTEAFAAIAPLRTGAGTRLKILEAMAAGVPVVSTRIGAEGLDVTPGKDILLADTPEDWAQAFRRLEDTKYRESLTAAGRRLVCARYDWTVLRETVHTTYMEWLKEPLKTG